MPVPPFRTVVVPLLTAVLALAALVGGWALFRQGSPKVTTPPERGSQVYVLTDDPGARIHIELRLTLNFGELYDGRPPPLDLTVRVRPSRDTPVRWAIVLDEGARLPWPAGEAAGNALPRGERRAFSDVWVQDGAQEAWFVRNASGWTFRDPDKLLVGEAGMAAVPGVLKDQLEGTDWWYPVSYSLAAEAGGQRFEDRLVQASPPPVSPTEWRWSGTDRLAIQALAERPSWTARAQRLQFLAGVLAGLGGGFLIWSLELWHGALTRPGPGGD